MKRHLLFPGLLLLLTVAIHSQNKIKYTYDEAGNRTSRMVILNASQIVKSDTQLPDSTELQDMLGDLSITIYPNPTRGQLSVEIEGSDPGEEEDLQIILISGQGQLLYSRKALSGINIVNMTAYPSGWYLMRVRIKDKIREYKVIKQ